MAKKKVLSDNKQVKTTQVELKEVKYCTGTNMKMSPEEGIIVMHSGSEIAAYAFSPSHFKQFSEKLSGVITEIEKNSKKSSVMKK